MAHDVGRVRSLVTSTGFFSAAEVEIAGELVTERLTKGIRSGYHFVLAERGSDLVAYACYGPIDGTDGSFDLYWIAVSPEEQGKGLGAQVYAAGGSGHAPGGRQADLRRYLIVGPLRADPRLLSAYGLYRAGAPARLLRPRRRQGHFQERAVLDPKLGIAGLSA